LLEQSVVLNVADYQALHNGNVMKIIL